MKKSVLALMVLPTFGLLLFLGTGCKPEGCTNPSAVNYDVDAEEDDGSCVYPSSVELHFNPKVGSDALVYNTDFMVNGRKTQFTKVQFYASTFKFTNGSSEEKVEDSYVLVHPEQHSYTLGGSLAAGNYTGLSFFLGVDTAVNTSVEPASWPTGHALAVTSPYYSYWTWNSGYIFVKLEGRVDTTAAANGTANYPFVFHIGTNNLIRTVNIPGNLTATDGSSLDVEIDVDFAAMLQSLDLRVENETHTTNDKSTAITIMNDAANSAFSIN